MADQGLLERNRIIMIGTTFKQKFADIEDVFSIDDYVVLYNEAFGQKLWRARPPAGHSLVAPPPLGAVNRLGLEKYRKFLAGIVAEDGEVQGEEASDTMAANA